MTANASTMPTSPSNILVSSVKPELPWWTWELFKVIHILLTIAALAINSLSLGVIYGVVVRLTPPLQILTSLALVHLVAPWSIVLIYFPHSVCQEEIQTAMELTCNNAGAMTIMGLAIMHFIATFHPLQYEAAITKRRLWISINLIWVIALITGHTHFFAVLSHHDFARPFCPQVYYKTNLAILVGAGFCAMAVTVVGAIYAGIVIKLRPLQAFANQNEPRKSLRGVMTGIMLATTYLVSWILFLLLKYLHQQETSRSPGLMIGLDITEVIILANCIISPIIYGARMTNMTAGYIGLYHKARAKIAGLWQKVHSQDPPDPLATPLDPIESIA